MSPTCRHFAGGAGLFSRRCGQPDAWPVGYNARPRQCQSAFGLSIGACQPAGFNGCRVLVITGWVDALRNPKIIALASILFALPLYVADRFCHQSHKIENLRLPKAVLIGLAQVLALIPGASRAGVTITAGRLWGLSAHRRRGFDAAVDASDWQLYPAWAD